MINCLMMRMRNKVLIAIVLILALLSGLILYVNKFILPVKVKNLVITLFKNSTGLDISIESLSYLPLTKFYLKDIAIYDKETKGPLIKIEGISFNFALGPLLKEKRLKAHLGLKDMTYGGNTVNGSVSSSMLWHPVHSHKKLLENIEGTIKFSDFTLKTAVLPSDIKEIRGLIEIGDNSVHLEDGSLNYQGITYNAEGLIKNLYNEEPNITLSIDSNIFKAQGDIAIALKDRYIKIKKIKGNLFNSEFSIMGDIKSLRDPQLNIYGESEIDLSVLSKAFLNSKYNFEGLEPTGSLNIAAFLNGRLGDMKSAEASLKLSSDKISIRGINVEEVYLHITSKDGLVNTERFTATPYYGLFNGSFGMNLKERRLPYNFSFLLKDADLASISSDLRLGEKEVTGLLSSKFFLKGHLKTIDSLRGSGWITVTNGRLWEIPLLKGVDELLGLPNLRSVIFKEAAGNFMIGERTVSTDDLTFYSDKANISVKGYVGFNGKIDFLLNTNITQDLIKVEGSSEAANIANMLISQAGNYIGKVKVTGTLKQPKYELAVTPIEDAFKKEIKGLLKDMLR